MIRSYLYEPDVQVSPQAIFTRPLRYFATRIRTGRDELDSYRGCSFGLRNEVRFDLRTYRRHDENTATLYLPDEIFEEDDVKSVVGEITEGMEVPSTAIAWQRGDAIVWGQVRRKREDRLYEAEARVIALKIAVQQPERSAPTSFIKDEVPNYLGLSERDQAESASRSPEPLWRQIVGNLISHQNTSEGPFEQGYAVWRNNQLTVTDKGVDYLNSMGFSVPG